jgi:hypothetical protein
MLEKFIELKNVFAREGVILYYDGAISHDLVVDIADIVKHKLQVDDCESSTMRKVFATVVEQLQNIFFYSDDIISPGGAEAGAKELRRGVVIVGQEGQGRYFVIGGNLINNAKIPALRERLTALQQMGRVELKQYGMEQRRKDPAKESRGAGLGIIEIAKQASAPMVFDFVPTAGDASYFFLKTII